jgi:GntR family transcriptional repressor for pyruvate dehydrogenase complex
MFEARGVLETAAAGLSAQRATPDQTAAMADLLAGMFAALADPRGFLVHDVRFHRAVASGSNNSVLVALVEMVSALLYEKRKDTIERARDLRESAEMHRRIYQAIRRRDAAAARAAMTEHLRRAREGWAREDAAATRARRSKSTAPRGSRSRRNKARRR